MKLGYNSKRKKIKVFDKTEFAPNFEEVLFKFIEEFLSNYGYVKDKSFHKKNTIRLYNTCNLFFIWKLHSGVKYVEFSFLSENGKVRVYSTVDYYLTWFVLILALFYLPSIYLSSISYLLLLPFLLIVGYSLFKNVFVEKVLLLPIMNLDNIKTESEFTAIEKKIITNCPACGNSLEIDDKECSDCGISILD